MNFLLIKEHLVVLRVHHWLKNILIFSPLLLSHQFDFDSINKALIAFLAFSLVASLVYIINDIRDIEFDRLHATKSLRPIASGSISSSSISYLIITLVILSVFFSLKVNTSFGQVLIIYFFLALLYTYGLKKIIYLDLMILTSFYIIRIFSGGVAIDAVVTGWLIIFSFFLFLSLAAIKRITEIQKYSDSDLRKMGKSYMHSNLDNLYTLTKISQLIALAMLSLYIFIAASDLYSKNFYLIPSVIIFYLWFSRIVSITKNNTMRDDPIIFAISDPVTYLSFFSIVAVFILAA